MEKIFANNTATSEVETKDVKSTKRILSIIAITLLLHLLLFNILWFTILRNTGTSNLENNHKSDTLFVEVNQLLGNRGDGFGNDNNEDGSSTPIFNDNTVKSTSTTNEKQTTVLTEIDPENSTSLKTKGSNIDKRSLYDKKLVKGVGDKTKEGGIAGDKDKGTNGTSSEYDKNNGFFLQGRKALDLPIPGNKSNVFGKVVVKIWVDRNGNVLKAIEGEGSTVTNDELIKMTLNAALKSKFNADPNAKEVQEGKITYTIKYLSK